MRNALILNRSLLLADGELFSIQQDAVFGRLAQLSHFYPKFNHWYREKVIPGLTSGEREIILKFSDQRLAGIAILKISESERKLCCLRVLDEFHGSGVGVHLFRDSFDRLGTSKPLLSVASEQAEKFERIFTFFGFQKVAEYPGMYRKNNTETSFNGLIA